MSLKQNQFRVKSRLGKTKLGTRELLYRIMYTTPDVHQILFITNKSQVISDDDSPSGIAEFAEFYMRMVGSGVNDELP